MTTAPRPTRRIIWAAALLLVAGCDGAVRTTVDAHNPTVAHVDVRLSGEAARAVTPDMLEQLLTTRCTGDVDVTDSADELTGSCTITGTRITESAGVTGVHQITSTDTGTVVVQLIEPAELTAALKDAADDPVLADAAAAGTRLTVHITNIDPNQIQWAAATPGALQPTTDGDTVTITAAVPNWETGTLTVTPGSNTPSLPWIPIVAAAAAAIAAGDWWRKRRRTPANP
jgi:hypothetical protein